SPRACIVERTISTPRSILYGFVREEPRIVPPRWRIPRVLESVRSIASLLSTPAQPYRNPTNSCPWALMPLRTMARMTALRPGQSPPPVSTPIRMARSQANAPRAGVSGPGRLARLGVGGLRHFVVELRQPAELPGQVPVTLAEQLHRGGEQDRADERGVDQDRDREPDAHLLELGHA